MNNNEYVLLKEFLRYYPFQVATAFWRAVEVQCVIDSHMPIGFGLDLGCGDGILTKILLEKVGPRELVGIDSDPKEIELARYLGIYKRLHMASASCIPEPGASFDFVFANSVLEHISNIDDIIKEVARVLKPKGAFLFTVPGNQFHECLKGPILPWVSRKAYLDSLDKRVAHLRYWGIEEWREHLLSSNMKIENFRYYLSKQEARRWEIIANLTAGLLCALYRRKKQPIEIQRMLGLKKVGFKLPTFLVNLLATIFTLNINNVAFDQLNACFLIQARKY